jgi:hypothetical protein
MNFIISTILMYVDEEDAFWLLRHIMTHPTMHMDGLYMDGLPGLGLMTYQFERVFALLHPDLYRHFRFHHIHPTMYVTQWFIGAFAMPPFPFKFSVRVWDSFLMEGKKTLFRIALALITLGKKELLALDFEGILFWLKGEDKSADSTIIKYTNDSCFNVAWGIVLTDEHLETCREEFATKGAAPPPGIE